MTSERFEVAVIGAGPGGITAGYHLKRAELDDFVILERADDFGGSWRDNVYPGLHVDIPTLFYQFPFARKGDWSRLFPPGAEIQRYNRQVAEDLNLYKHFRGGCNVEREVWDEQQQVWRLYIAGRDPIEARFVINAIGGYINAKPVDIPGITNFGGAVLRPNAWDTEYDYGGKRVAVIGTGSSSVQIVAAVAQTAAHVDVYQRTPSWILPKPDPELSPRAQRILGLPGVTAILNGMLNAAMELPLQLICNVLPILPRTLLATLLPQYDKIWRGLYRALLRTKIKDPVLREAMIPRYGVLAKRPILSENFLDVVASDAASLIVDPIETVTAAGIRTCGGIERRYDLIVTATGYELFTDPETYRPGTLVGPDGFDLAEDYRRHGVRSYGGSAHPGLPNRWVLVGPQGYVGGAWHTFLDLAARHAVRVIGEARRRGATGARVRPEAFTKWVAKMRRHEKVISTYVVDCNPNLRTYFVNSHGEALYYRPQTISGAIWFSRFSALGDYRFDRPRFAETPVRSINKEIEVSA